MEVSTCYRHIETDIISKELSGCMHTHTHTHTHIYIYICIWNVNLKDFMEIKKTSK